MPAKRSKTEPSARSQLLLPFDAQPRAEATPKRTQRARDPVRRTDGFQDEIHVAEIFMQIVRKRRLKDILSAHVAFRPYRNTLYSYKVQDNGSARIHFHTAFRQATDLVIEQSCHLMLCRRRDARRRLDRSAYDRFVETIPSSAFKLPGARPVQKRALSKPGRHRSLDESFDRVNREYFEGRLSKPELCWSPQRARRQLGSYNETDDRLIVSRIFDSPKVPLYVLDYLMYHELLHKHLGIGQRVNGRRQMHTAEFKRRERRYKRYREALRFLNAM